jgi:hypothetical protein
LVTTIEAPVSDTVSMRSRHLALNSAAEIVAAAGRLRDAAFMTMNVTIARGSVQRPVRPIAVRDHRAAWDRRVAIGRRDRSGTLRAP